MIGDQVRSAAASAPCTVPRRASSAARCARTSFLCTLQRGARRSADGESPVSLCRMRRSQAGEPVGPAPPTTWSFARGIFSSGSISRGVLTPGGPRRKPSRRTGRSWRPCRVSEGDRGYRFVRLFLASFAAAPVHTQTNASTATTVGHAPGQRPRRGRDELPPIRLVGGTAVILPFLRHHNQWRIQDSRARWSEGLQNGKKPTSTRPGSCRRRRSRWCPRRRG